MSGPGLGVFLAIIGKLSYDLVKFGAQSLKTFFGIGKAAADQKQVQESIVQTLLKNQGVLSSILNTQGGQNAQALKFLGLLNQQAAAMQTIESLAGGIASTVYSSGFRATAGGLQRKGKAADGYLPAQEAADVSRGVGGASPSSKVVGDMALYMVTNDLTPAEVLDPSKEINFPESVISLFRGEMGYPADGFPKELGKKILKDKVAIDGRAGAHLKPVDLDAVKKEAEEKVGRHLTDTDLASYLMYPKVFSTFANHHKLNGDVSLLPTPVFFYGLNIGEEIAIEIDPGKTLVIRLQGMTQVDEEGIVRVFFELNGQPRTMKVKKHGAVATKVGRTKAESGNAKHIAAPLPGMIATLAVKEGQSVQKGSPLVSIEAMKMETMITANEDGVIKKIHISSGNQVDAKDLLIEMA